MTPEAIHDYCTRELGSFPPKVVTYHNGVLVALRNGDGDRVATILDNGMAPDAIKERLAGLYKIKAGNTPSQATMAKFRAQSEAAIDDMTAVVTDATVNRDPLSYWKSTASEFGISKDAEVKVTVSRPPHMKSADEIRKHQAEKLGQTPKDPEVNKWLD